MKNELKHRWAVVLLAVAGLLLPGLSFAQTQARADSTVRILRLEILNNRKTELKQKIARADEMRNRNIEGVSPETMEQMNMAQDSVCLELRSELIAVELEIAELTPDELSGRLLQQLNRLCKRQQEE